MVNIVTLHATVSGAAQTVTLNYDANDSAYYAATALARSLDGMTAINPTGGGPISGSQVANLVVPSSFGGTNVTANGFSSIVVGEVQNALTVQGLSATQAATQTILVGDAGLSFNFVDTPSYGAAGGAPVMMYIGGGTNEISFAGSHARAGVYLSGGANTVVAGDGATTIDGGPGSSLIEGGSGPILVDANGSDTVDLGSGEATVSVQGRASALVFGGSGPLVFQGGTSASTVIGGSAGETVYGATGGGVFVGGSSGINALYGATDPQTGAAASGGMLTLTGGGSFSYLQGDSNGGDVLRQGGAASAEIVSEGANDAIYGGSGTSDIVLAGTAGSDVVQLADGAATVTAVGSARADVIGGMGPLAFFGGSAASTVAGGTGSTTIYAGPGGGTFSGGSDGNNFLYGATAPLSVVGTTTLGGGPAGGGPVTLVGAGSSSYLQGQTNGGDLLEAGVAGSSTIVSAGAGDTIIGGSGSSVIVLNAASGVDTVKPGLGAATVSADAQAGAYVIGGAGALTFFGGTASSTVIAGAGGDNYVLTGVGGGVFAGGSGGSNSIVGGSGSVTLFGAVGSSAAGDYLEGNSVGGDLLVAGSGNDTLRASAIGSDTLVGGAGDDVFAIDRDTLPGSSSTNSYLITHYHAGDILALSPGDIPNGSLNLDANGNAVITLANNVKLTIEGSANTAVSFAPSTLGGVASTHPFG
jgi:serralysin